MIVRDDFDRLLTVWLNESAGAGVPDYLDETLDGLATIPQRPAWMRPWRWLTMQLTIPRVVIPRAVPILAVLVLLIAALLAAALLVGSRPRVPSPFGLASTGMFVFDRDGQAFIVNADGSEVRSLTEEEGPTMHRGPTFSRDGQRLAWWSIQADGRPPELWIARTDGSDRHLVTRLEPTDSIDPYFAAVSWSPDGSRLAFATTGGALVVVANDGSHVSRRDPDSTLRFDPSWSPVGDVIAYRGQESSDPTSARRVYIARPDLTGEMPISGRSLGFNAMLDPQWSPTGDKILYEAVYGSPLGQDFGQIVVATSIDGSWREKELIHSAVTDWVPRWSNDGGRLAFMRQKTDISEGTLFVANADGTNVHQLSERLLSTASPCWTPDDRGIAVLVGQPGLPIEQQTTARYVVLDAMTGDIRVEMPAGRILGAFACSWQRLAP